MGCCFSCSQVKRDAAYLRTVPALDGCAPGVRSGVVDIRHSPETLKACEDGQGSLADVSVTMAYKTTFDPVKSDPGLHIVLIHGTGLLQETYWWSRESLLRAGEEAMANHLSPQQDTKSIADILIKGGASVTTFSLRGHGTSQVTASPWTTKLLGADVAEAFKAVFPGQRAHFHGHSLGFGAALSVAFNYGEIVRSVSGGGFLANRERIADFKAWFFSRQPVVRAIGMRGMGTAGDLVLKLKPKGSMSNHFQYTSIDGFQRASASWLHFNEGEKLKTLQAPLLWLAPVLDHLAGVKLKDVQAEFDQVPHEKKRLVVFDATGKEDHIHPLLDPEDYFGKHLMDFVKEYGSSV